MQLQELIINPGADGKAFVAIAGVNTAVGKQRPHVTLPEDKVMELLRLVDEQIQATVPVTETVAKELAIAELRSKNDELAATLDASQKALKEAQEVIKALVPDPPKVEADLPPTE